MPKRRNSEEEFSTSVRKKHRIEEDDDSEGDENDESVIEIHKMPLYDVVIVGAGPGGTYSAYQLRDSGLTVGVFEYSDRVGGRAYTYQQDDYPDVNLELGAMRYIVGAHPRLEKLIRELGLKSKVFVDGIGDSKDITRFYLRGRNLSLSEVLSGDIPYDLSPEEKANQGRLLEYYLEKLTGRKHTFPLSRSDMMNLTLEDGRHLYTLTFDEAFDLVATGEGKALVQDTLSFHSICTGNDTVINIFDFTKGVNDWGKRDQCKHQQICTVVEGMDQVPKKLLQAFMDESPEKNTFTPNKQLVKLRRGSDGIYKLHFDRTSSNKMGTCKTNEPQMVVLAKRVILALPVYALKQLDWDKLSLTRAVEGYSAMRSMHASKVFMFFCQPWWLRCKNRKNRAKVLKSNTDFCQMYDWDDYRDNDSGTYVLIVSYADTGNTDRLHHLNSLGEPMEGSEAGSHKVTEALKDRILHQLAEAFGIPRDDIPEPVSAVSQFWTDYPFGGGWVMWQAPYNYDDAISVTRRPSLTDEVYVVGSDYSWGARAEWMEGALETSENIIQDYFQQK